MKIQLTDSLINEIHQFNKGKTNALKVVGFGAIGLYVLALLAGVAAIILLAGGI